MPQRTDDFQRINIQQIAISDADKFDYYNYVAYAFQIVEVRLHEDVVSRDIIIYDLKNFIPKHVTKFNPSALRKAALVLEVSSTFELNLDDC